MTDIPPPLEGEMDFIHDSIEKMRRKQRAQDDREDDDHHVCLVDPPGQPVPNGRRFVAARFDHPLRELLAHQGGMFYAWDGTCWPPLDDADLRAQLYQHFENATYEHETKDGVEIRPFAPNRYKVADLLDALRAVAHIPVTVTTPSWLSGQGVAPADELVACTNGLVHVPTRSLHSHTPDYFAHHAIDFAYDAKAPKPERWLAFLDVLWPGDKEAVSTLQEIFGCLVSGDTRQQKMFLLVGPKRSGKGTIARIIKNMMGIHNVAGPTLAGLGTNFGLSPLIGKPVAIVSDARLKASDTSIVTERLLSISGEDTLTVDRKYKEPWTGQFGSRIVILSNELPRLSDSSGALASRFIALMMTRSFYGRENPNLTAELTTELPGIFLWALDGLERLRARGRFEQPKSSKDAIRQIEDLGSPVGAFIRDECEVGFKFSVPVVALYNTWKTWCEDHGMRPSTAQMFGKDLRAAYPSIKVTQPRDGGPRHRIYRAIGVVARTGTRSTPLYSPKETTYPTRNTDPGSSDGDAISSDQNNALDRVPSRASDLIANAITGLDVTLEDALKCFDDSDLELIQTGDMDADVIRHAVQLFTLGENP